MTIFCIEQYVTNIRPAKKPLEINTNGGIMMVTQQCEIPFLGTHWFNNEVITNIISLADITKKFRVTIDSQKEKALVVHMDDKIVKFEQMPGGLYARKPGDTIGINYKTNIKSKDNKIKHANNYLTVNENHKFLSNAQ